MGRAKKSEWEPQTKIILALSINSELEQYKMPKKTGLSYRTILRTLKSLEGKEIELVRTELSEKGGKDKKIYSLTSRGVVYSLMPKVTWTEPERLNKLVRAHSDKALLFRKWSLFQQAGLEKTVTDLLKEEVEELQKVIRACPELSYNVYEDDLKQIDDVVLTKIAFSSLPQNHEIIKLLKSDLELKSFITESLRIKKKTLEENLEIIKSKEAFWAS